MGYIVEYTAPHSLEVSPPIQSRFDTKQKAEKFAQYVRESLKSPHVLIIDEEEAKRRADQEREEREREQRRREHEAKLQREAREEEERQRAAIAKAREDFERKKREEEERRKQAIEKFAADRPDFADDAEAWRRTVEELGDLLDT